ncbi:MAG: hypothetical protein WD556_02620 [Actinomycetota bacterium]
MTLFTEPVEDPDRDCQCRRAGPLRSHNGTPQVLGRDVSGPESVRNDESATRSEESLQGGLEDLELNALPIPELLELKTAAEAAVARNRVGQDGRADLVGNVNYFGVIDDLNGSDLRHPDGAWTPERVRTLLDEETPRGPS